MFKLSLNSPCYFLLVAVHPPVLRAGAWLATRDAATATATAAAHIVVVLKGSPTIMGVFFVFVLFCFCAL